MAPRYPTPMFVINDAEIKEKVKAYLQTTAFPCSDLVRLSTDHFNFTYRATTQREPDEEPRHVIIKHAESYPAYFDPVAVEGADLCDTIRVYYEAMMLHATISIDLNPIPESDWMWKGRAVGPSVHVITPAKYAYIPEIATLIMERYPVQQDLAAYMKTCSSSHREWRAYISSYPGLNFDIPVAIGAALREFHEWGAGQAVKAQELRAKLQASRSSDRKFAQLFHNIHQENPVDQQLNDILLSVKQFAWGETKGFQMIHGDFTPANILVTGMHAIDFKSTEDEDPIREPMKLAIVDWEAVQMGHRAFDVGMMLAELFTYAFFDQITLARDFMEGFLAGYQYGTAGLSAAFRFQILVAAGAHFLGVTKRDRSRNKKFPENMKELMGMAKCMLMYGWEGIQQAEHAEMAREHVRFWENTAFRCVFQSPLSHHKLPSLKGQVNRTAEYMDFMEQISLQDHQSVNSQKSGDKCPKRSNLAEMIKGLFKRRKSNE